MAKVNRALKAKTPTDGNRLYNPGALMDYHRDTATKDEPGGWNGPYPVVRNDPDRGKVICRVHGQDVDVNFRKARLSLFVEVPI